MEKAIETQASLGTEPVTEQAMLRESPLSGEAAFRATIDGHGGAGG